MEEDKIILVYPGFWAGPVFTHGEEVLVFISLRTTSYTEFLDEVHKLVQADQQAFEYVLHCFIHIEDGPLKSFIMSDRDLHRVAKIFTTPKIYVSLKPKHPAQGNPSFNHHHHGVLDLIEDNFSTKNKPYPYPYWLAPNFHGAGHNSAPWPAPGSAPVANQPKPGSVPVISPPNPNGALVVDKLKPSSKPAVNKPKPNSAPVVNQPKSGSVPLAAQTRLLKRPVDVNQPCKPTDYETNGSYKRRMLDLKVDGNPGLLKVDEDDEESSY